MVVPYWLNINIVMFLYKQLRVSKDHAVRDISRSCRLVQWNIHGDQLSFLRSGWLSEAQPVDLVYTSKSMLVILLQYL